MQQERMASAKCPKTESAFILAIAAELDDLRRRTRGYPSTSIRMRLMRPKLEEAHTDEEETTRPSIS